MRTQSTFALIAHFIAAVAVTGTAHAANPPEVQSELELAASKLKGHNDGVVMVSDTIIGDHSLEIRFKAAPNVTSATAAERIKVRAKSWAQSVCAEDTLSAFLRRTGTTVSMSFETAPGVYETQGRVEPTTCPESQVRTINGKVLYPRPSRDEANSKVSNHLKYTLRDFGSAIINCTDVSQAIWLKLVLMPRVYGYVMRCEINAKNGFGGYVGFESRYYYFNGPTFEEFDYEPKMGWLEQ